METPEKQSAMISNVNGFFNNCGNVDVVSMDLTGMQAVVFKGWKHTAVMEMLYRLNKSFSGMIFIAVGRTVSSPGEISRSYMSAYELYRNRFLYINYGVVTDDVLNAEPVSTADIPALTSQMYAYMEINDTEKLNGVLDRFMESMLTADNTPEKAKISCITMLMDVRSQMSRSAADKKPENMISDDFVNEISDMHSLSQMVEAIRTKLTDISDACFGKTTKSTMERVVQYIRANYNRELRLEMLAGIFGYNSAYLGKVFHQYTGDNFNNYLDEIRISEAKRLLAKDEYRVYEVAEMVGYSNINYFHNKFKKYVGMSPLSYKKQFGGGKDE